MNGLVCIAVLAATSGQDRPLVAAHPLEVTGVTGAAAAEVDDDFSIELSRQPIDLVSRYEIDQALAAKRCAGGAPPCLTKLASATGAKLALWAAIRIDAESYRVQAKVVDASGAAVREAVDLSFPKDLTQPRSPQVRAAFKALFAKLSLEKEKEPAPKPIAPVAVTPPDAGPVVDVVQPPPPRTSPLKTLGLTAGGLALAAGVSAVGLGIWNATTAGGINGREIEENIRPEDVGAARDVKRNTSIAAGLGIGAGVLAAVAVVMLVSSGGDERVSVGAAPLPGGAHVVIGGSFP